MNKNIIENEYFPIFGDIFPFFTKQSQLLQEYDEVRIECYRELTKLPEINDNNGHDYDHRADTLIVTYKDIVIGGGKVVGKFPGDQHLIPLDDSELNLEKQFKDFNLDQVPYCEFTRMSILKPFRSPKLLHAISNELILYSIAKGYKYMFSVSSLAQARCNRQSAKVLGLPFEYNIHTNMEVPNHNNKYGDLKVVISSLEFPSHWKGIKTHSIKIY
tara:strand:- start:2573 stop:3220 length:648 start_codon:yes stop_codon:yes gene_type:complete